LGKRINFYEISSVFSFLFLISLSERFIFYDLLIIFVLACFVYFFSEKESGFLGEILKKDILVLVGKYSFSIYMLHIFVISIYEFILKNILEINVSSIRGIYSIILNGTFCITTILLSKYSYIYIEDYFRKKSKDYVKKKLINVI